MRISIRGQHLLDEFMDVLVLLNIATWEQVNPTRFYVFHEVGPSFYPDPSIPKTQKDGEEK